MSTQMSSSLRSLPCLPQLKWTSSLLCFSSDSMEFPEKPLPGWLSAHQHYLSTDKFFHTDLCSNLGSCVPKQSVISYGWALASLGPPWYLPSSWQGLNTAIPQKTQAKQKLWRQKELQPLSLFYKTEMCCNPSTSPAGQSVCCHQPAAPASFLQPNLTFLKGHYHPPPIPQHNLKQEQAFPHRTRGNHTCSPSSDLPFKANFMAQKCFGGKERSGLVLGVKSCGNQSCSEIFRLGRMITWSPLKTLKFPLIRAVFLKTKHMAGPIFGRRESVVLEGEDMTATRHMFCAAVLWDEPTLHRISL